MDDGLEDTEYNLREFEENYRYLFNSLFHRVAARVVLMELFFLRYPRERQNCRSHLDPSIQIVRRLANDYHAAFVPLDGIMNAKGIENDFQTYTGDDGVHPTLTGHALIADAWIHYLDF